MVYVIEFVIDDGRRRLAFRDTPQEAHSLFEAAINPITGGTSIKGGKGAFVEEAKLFVVQTDDRREAKAAVEEGRAELVRDSAAERQAFAEAFNRSLDL
jgi:hypothetical protein